MKKLLTLIICFILLFGSNIFAQSDFGPHFGVYALLSFPTGDFGDNSNDDDGFATLGYGGGAEFTMPLGKPGLGWITGVGLIFNPYDENDLVDEVFGSEMRDYFESTMTMNVPIMTGLKYQIPLGSIEGFGMFQVGLNIPKMGTWELNDVYYYGEPADLTFEFETKPTFGFVIGAGLVINEMFTISARYLGLGETEIDDATVTVNGESLPWTDAEGDHQISMFIITAGINFGF